MTINVDLRSLQGHELAFLIHILTDETMALLNVFPPLGLELLDVLHNELHGRAEKKLGEWQVTLTFDYAADEVLLQAQAAGRWCEAVITRTSQHEGFENVTGLLKSLQSQLAEGAANLLQRRQLLESLTNGQGKSNIV